jgi:branched-chain amino acid transport system substrate-binding protein
LRGRTIVRGQCRTRARATDRGAAEIGVLSDFSSVYSDIGGIGNVEATKMAIEDFGGSMFGKPIELVTADVLNKPDIAASIARKWYENEGVDMIIDLPTSATALAVMELSKQFEKIMIVTDAASSDITGKCPRLHVSKTPVAALT